MEGDGISMPRGQSHLQVLEPQSGGFLKETEATFHGGRLTALG